MKILFTRFKISRYLVSDLDKRNENEQNKQVVKDADSSDDDVDDLESKVTMTLSARSRMLARYSVRSSSTDDDVVTSFQTSAGKEVFSIVAKGCLARLPQQRICYVLASREGVLLLLLLLLNAYPGSGILL